MNAADLRHRIIIQQLGEDGRDPDGFVTHAGWSDYLQLWAKITPLSGRDLMAAQAEQSQVTARMMIRHRTDIDTTMRVIHRGQIYAIASQGQADNKSGLEYLTFLLSGGIERWRE